MSHRKSWDKIKMIEAVIAVKNKEMGLLKASKIFQVPRSTLKDYVKKPEDELQKLLDVPLGRRPVLPPDVEDQLVEYCLQMDKTYYGLTTKDVKRMAFQLAIRNNLRHPFSENTKSAGRKWLRLFFKRHPALCLRKPQPLSLARIKGFSSENVKKFFDILKPELERVKFLATRIFNVDETGVTSVQHRSMKVVSLKGKHEVHKVSSAERGSLVTLVTCMSASGNFVPPMFVFPRKRMKDELMDGAPPGSIAGCHPSGWIQSDLFTKWMNHFISYVKPTEKDPVVLILDGHTTHTRNIDVIDLARENSVSLVCLPPHSSNHMQPLDKTFMKVFKTYFAQEIENWLAMHPFRAVTVYQVAELVGKAYVRSATMEVAMKGFKATGILPYNPNIFTDAHFLQHQQSVTQENQQQTNTPDSPLEQSHNPTPIVSPKDIRPIPTLKLSSTSNDRAGSAALVSGSPFKTALIESMEKKKKRQAPSLQTPSTSGKILGKVAKESAPKKRKSKKWKEVLSSSDDDEEPPYVSTDDNDSSCDEEDNDALCSVCEGLYSNDCHGETWLKCEMCNKWSHDKCDKRKVKKTKSYICVECS